LFGHAESVRSGGLGATGELDASGDVGTGDDIGTGDDAGADGECSIGTSDHGGSPGGPLIASMFVPSVLLRPGPVTDPLGASTLPARPISPGEATATGSS